MKSAARPVRPKRIVGERFRIAGVGASAGGLKALKELFAAVPADTRMAFVVVQHLEPNRPSLLAELLGSGAPLPVREVAGRTRLAPGHVYVAPPGKRLTLRDRTLHVHAAPRGRKHRQPIDWFLISLAETERGNAIAVILSGDADDGAVGVARVHEAGGLVLAQDPATAGHPSMPTAAAATGAVDQVLDAARIGRALTAIAAEPAGRRSKKGRMLEEAGRRAGDVDPALLERALNAIRTSCGVDLRSYKRATLARRFAHRLSVLNLPAATYVARLESDADEARKLYAEMLIHVTGFFRDTQAYAALRHKVFPVLHTEAAGDAPIRIWVAGCATGQEVYSIAIELLEQLAERGSRAPLRIFATDLDVAALEVARTGTYSEAQLAGVSPERRQRWFEHVEGGHRVLPSVRAMCTFARHDLLADAPFSNLDLVSCRNVLIYLGAGAQKRALALLHYALRPQGFLVLGSSETTQALPGGFSPVDAKQKIFRRRALRGAVPDFGALRGSRSKPAQAAAAARWTSQDLRAAADRATLAHHTPPGLVVDEDLQVVHFRGDVGAYVETSAGDASLSLTRLARDGLLFDLRAAILAARETRGVVERESVRIDRHKNTSGVSVVAIPIQPPGSDEQFCLVLFEEHAATAAEAKSPAERATRTDGLATQLAETRRHLQVVLEQHDLALAEVRGANEEILSSNEELQSTNEELETAKEELQSAYEELTTVNEELQNRNQELTHANNDLINVLQTVEIPILMLDGERRIRVFTPRAGALLNLIAADVGRPLSDIKTGFLALDRGPLQRGATGRTHHDVKDAAGRWYSMTTRPYTTMAGTTDGTVIVLLDIDESKRALQRSEGARELAEGIVDTVRQPLLVVDGSLAIQTANPAFHAIFGAPGSKGDGDGGVIAALRTDLEEVIRSGHGFRDRTFAVEIPGRGRSTMLASAQPIEDQRSHLVLIALDDTPVPVQPLRARAQN